MNILEVEDMIKGLPDQALQQEAQAPTGQVPQFLVISEIQRRTDMRKRFQQEQQPQGTVADQIVQEGVMGVMPPQAMPPQAMPPQGMPPQQMFNGGIIRLQEGGSTSMPGAGALEPIMYAIQEKAKDIARITGREFDEVYQILLRQAQEQNPDYSMIAPAGLGMSMDDLPSLPEGAGSNVPEMFQSGRDANTQLASLPDPSNAYQTLLRQAQENMPDYSMIAPAGLGLPSMPNATLDMPTREEARAADKARVASIREGISPLTEGISPLGTYGSTPEEFAAQRGQISLSDLGQTDVTLPDRTRGEGVTSARESYIPQEMNLPSGTNFLSSIADGMRQTPLGEYSRTAEQGIIDVYNKDGLSAAIGQAGRAGIGGIIPFLETAVEGYKPAGRALVSTIDYLTSGPARALDQFVTGSVEDPLTLGDIGSSLFGGEERAPLEEVKVDAKARQLSPEMEALLKAAQNTTQDASNRDASSKVVGTLYEGGGSKEVQGTSGRQAQGLPDPGKSDALDFSDLIKESKDAAMANALMQLGAGIAGGDLSKGISAAGVAAAKGQQDARAMAIRKRLAEYQAGREDIARGEKGRQFDDQMDLLEKKIGATLTASTLTSQRENLRALAGEVASLRENLTIMSDSEKARFRVLEQQLYSMLGIDMPKGDVVAGIPAGESGTWGIAGR